MEIPDNLNLLALALSVVTPLFLDAIQDALLAVGGMTLLRYYLSFFLDREAMGEGDIIVAGTMGALLGFPAFLYALFIAAIVAMIPSLINTIISKMSYKKYSLKLKKLKWSQKERHLTLNDYNRQWIGLSELRHPQVPFVPFLIIGTFITYMFNTQVQSIVDLIIYG
jgi:prepilin signal peptidase PulO-like enzyme (type II secretory pathway)